MKVLIIRFSSIGDVVLTTPVPRALKVQLDDVEVHYCTKQPFAVLLQNNPYIDQVYTLGQDGLGPLIKQLKQQRYDVVIDLHNNLRTRIIKLRLGVKAYTFNKINWAKWVMVNLKINIMPNVHIVDRYMATVEALGVKKDSLGLDYFIPEKDEIETDWLPDTHRKEYVVFAIGGNHNTKKLPLKRMIELCDRINKPIILLGGKEDAAVGEQIEAFFARNESSAPLEPKLFELNKKAIIFNACGKLNLNQSASVIKRSVVVFTHDTGMMHVAAALRKRVFSIWGNTIPAFGMYPYKTQFTIFENNKLSCRPCSKIGHDKCPKGHFKCMQDIVFDFYLP